MGRFVTVSLCGAAGESEQPFCRQAELNDIFSAIRTEDCRAIFLTSDTGLGASTILHQLAQESQDLVPVLLVRGSRSLVKIPFGVLSPLINWEGSAPEGFRLGILRQLLDVIEERQRLLGDEATGYPDRPLFVVDDAHAIDEGTAELLVTLVLTGAANLVASHSVRHRLPQALSRLWSMGLAENIVLLPLSQSQGHDFCEALLAGPVLPATSWNYWHTAAGNPMFMKLLVAEALAEGHLIKRGETWVGIGSPQSHGQGLEEAVVSVLHGLSPDGKAALNLVALAEPLLEESLRRLVPAEAVKELLDWPVIRYESENSELLVLANPIYGHVIRDLVPLSQSRMLHERLILEMPAHITSKESVVRRVVWAVDVGAEVDDETLLRTAVLATKMFQSLTALELTRHIRGENYLLQAAMVQARAHYNLGDYHAAFEAMGSISRAATTVQELTYGALLRASTRSALGMSVQVLNSDARELREAGVRLALAEPGSADSILAISESGALMVELLAMSRAGNYAQMSALTGLLWSQQSLATADGKLNRAMALTMDAERLTAQGFPEQGMQRAAEAFAIEHSEEHEVFFLPETIMLRQLTALLCAGHWEIAIGIIEDFALEGGPIIFSFGGGASVLRGMVSLRAGSFEAALETLTDGLEALRVSDPQQLLGFCTAMAAYCAGRLGRNALAQTLLDESVESTGLFVVLAHERAFNSATRHLLMPDGAGLAELVDQADAALESQSCLLELVALALALELGEESLAGRVAEVAGNVEGPWARGLSLYAAALHAGSGQMLNAAADYLAQSGAVGMAQQASLKSLQLQDDGAANAPFRTYLVPEQTGSDVPTGQLTLREREIARLAAAGNSDRAIAADLQISPRTVQGHLLKVYAKMGISGRAEIVGLGGD